MANVFEVSTREYEFSHGKKPRGVGYWAFTAKADGQVVKNAEGAEDVYWFSGPYGVAVKSAKQYFSDKANALANRSWMVEIVVGS